MAERQSPDEELVAVTYIGPPVWRDVRDADGNLVRRERTDAPYTSLAPSVDGVYPRHFADHLVKHYGPDSRTPLFKLDRKAKPAAGDDVPVAEGFSGTPADVLTAAPAGAEPVALAPAEPPEPSRSRRRTTQEGR